MGKIIKSIDCPNEEYKAGSVIFEEGSPGDCFYVVKSGKIGIYKNHGKPEAVQLSMVTDGKVLGELAAMDGQPRIATAVAETDVVVVKIPSQSLKYQLEQCPPWFQTIILDLVVRLRNTGTLLSENGINDPNSLSSQASSKE